MTTGYLLTIDWFNTVLGRVKNWKGVGDTVPASTVKKINYYYYFFNL